MVIVLLAGLGVTPARGGVGIEMTAAHAGAGGMDVAEVFHWMVVAALAFAIVAMAAIILMEERSLRGPGRGAPTRTGAAGRGAGRVGAEAGASLCPAAYPATRSRREM